MVKITISIYNKQAANRRIEPQWHQDTKMHKVYLVLLGVLVPSWFINNNESAPGLFRDVVFYGQAILKTPGKRQFIRIFQFAAKGYTPGNSGNA